MQGRLDGLRFDIEKISRSNDKAKYKVYMKVPMRLGWIERMKFIVEGHGMRQAFQMRHVKNEGDMVYFETEVELVTQAIYHYYFSFEANKEFIYFKKGNSDSLNSITDDEKWQMPVNFEVPEWAKDKMMYQIYVDRFKSDGTRLNPMPRRTIHKNWNEDVVVGPNKDGIWNADFFGGNINGIIEKLDYIKSLGVSILYLGPIMCSQSNHRYDTGDYEKVDPYAGTNKDLKRLCDEAHKRGMKVILDSVFNHTGSDSKYYNEFGSYPELGAYQSKNSKYYPFYKINGYFDEGYKSHWDLEDKYPPLEGKNRKWRSYVYDAKGIIDLWYRFGKDGLNFETQEETISDEVVTWGFHFFNHILKLKEGSFKFENNRFWYLASGRFVEISNRIMYVLFGLKDRIRDLNIENLGIKDVLNYLTLDGLVTFYKTNNKDKLCLVFDEIKKMYPENTVYHIVNYIRGIDITKTILQMTDEKVEKDAFVPYRKYLHNDKREFSYWWNHGNLPVCDGNSKEWQQYIYGEGGIIDKWFKLGIDGLRLDVADELTDEFIEGIRRAVKRNKEDGFILGEVWKNPMRMGRSYISSGKAMDSVMNYVLVDALMRYFKYGDVTKLAEIVRQLRTEYPKETMHSLMNFTSTHDISRAINIFGTQEFAYDKDWAWNLYRDGDEDREWQKGYRMTEAQYAFGKKIYETYLFTMAFMPGNLSIFYGDEIGMQGLGNLANRRPFTWDNVDRELLEFVRKIGRIKNSEKFLTKADLHLRDINDRYFMFERETPEESALVTVSRVGDTTGLYIPNDYQNVSDMYTLNGSTPQELKPYGGLVLKKKN